MSPILFTELTADPKLALASEVLILPLREIEIEHNEFSKFDHLWREVQSQHYLEYYNHAYEATACIRYRSQINTPQRVYVEVPKELFSNLLWEAELWNSNEFIGGSVPVHPILWSVESSEEIPWKKEGF